VAKDRVDRDDEDLVRLYLTDIGQYTLLTKDDEVRLAKAIEAGNEALVELDAAGKDLTPARKRELRRTARQGEEAERQFVQSNLRLVVSIAKKYQASGLPLLDLIQEGNLGLMHAVEKFDWRKGFKFSTYATWWIRQAITRGIANTGRTIRLPVHAGDTLARLQKARSRLELKYGRPATLSELAREVEMPEDKVTEALRFAAEPLSLSEPLREDGDAELGDVSQRSGPRADAVRRRDVGQAADGQLGLAVDVEADRRAVECADRVALVDLPQHRRRRELPRDRNSAAVELRLRRSSAPRGSTNRLVRTRRKGREALSRRRRGGRHAHARWR